MRALRRLLPIAGPVRVHRCRPGNRRGPTRPGRREPREMARQRGARACLAERAQGVCERDGSRGLELRGRGHLGPARRAQRHGGGLERARLGRANHAPPARAGAGRGLRAHALPGEQVLLYPLRHVQGGGGQRRDGARAGLRAARRVLEPPRPAGAGLLTGDGRAPARCPASGSTTGRR